MKLFGRIDSLIDSNDRVFFFGLPFDLLSLSMGRTYLVIENSKLCLYVSGSEVARFTTDGILLNKTITENAF